MRAFIFIAAIGMQAAFAQTAPALAENDSAFTDSRDGKRYKTVVIGSAKWMAENLNYGKSGMCYGNNAENCAKYGRLYDWASAKKACPNGWRLPDADERDALIKIAGGKSVAGKKLKSAQGWNDNGNGIDSYGFSALPGGECYKDSVGKFDFRLQGIYGNWWTGTEASYDVSKAEFFTINEKGKLSAHGNDKADLFSVRCVWIPPAPAAAAPVVIPVAPVAAAPAVIPVAPAAPAPAVASALPKASAAPAPVAAAPAVVIPVAPVAVVPIAPAPIVASALPKASAAPAAAPSIAPAAPAAPVASAPPALIVAPIVQDTTVSEQDTVASMQDTVANAPAQDTASRLEQFMDKANIGIKVGLVFPNMSYTEKGQDNYKSSVYSNGTFEIFTEYMLNFPFSVRPGLKFLTRGQHISEADFTYKLNAQYAEITLPAVYSFAPVKNNIHPYVLGGPVLGIARGGDIMYRDRGEDAYKIKINKSNFSSYALGLYIGAGAKYEYTLKDIQIPALKGKEYAIYPGLEIGYHFGLTNTYSDKELSGKANVLNNGVENSVKGSRKNRGFEIGAMLSVPLAYFKKSKEPKQEPLEEKLCYTIEDIKELIKEGKDVSGKMICAVKLVNFQTGRSVLTDKDKEYLDGIVALMKTNGLIRIRVNGHTDNVGGDEFNMNLSKDRAKAVYDYLKTKIEDGSRLSYDYFGMTRPIADNNTEDGRAINRRVEFEIFSY